MRKIISVFFAAVFVLCLSPPVFAANETEAKTELTFIYSPSSPTYTVEVDGTWKKGTDTGLTITTNGDISKFEGVKINGVLIDSSNYTLSGNTVITLKPEFLETLSAGEHSITIVFADGSVQTVFTVLAADGTQPGDKDTSPNPNTPGNTVKPDGKGKYIEYDPDGKAVGEWKWDDEAGLWIFKEYPVPLAPGDPGYPNTGDNSNPILWLCLGGSALLCLGGTVIAGRKRKRHRTDEQ